MIGVVTNSRRSRRAAGRVKVKFPSLGDEVESDWARVVTVGGGSQRGMTFLPEVNDEVIVGFEGGDVAGRWFSAACTTAGTRGLDFGVAERRRSRTRQITSRLGHFVELADGDAPADQHICADPRRRRGTRSMSARTEFAPRFPPALPTTIKPARRASRSIDATGTMTMQAKKITIKADDRRRDPGREHHRRRRTPSGRGRRPTAQLKRRQRARRSCPRPARPPSRARW